MQDMRRAGQMLAIALVMGVAAAVGACSSSPGAGLSTAPSAQATEPSRVLSPSPSATVVPGTQLSGAGAFEGTVRQVPVNGIRIGYRQFGSGPDLILVTGDTAAMSLWTADLLSELARHFRVTIFDNRGIGHLYGGRV